MKNRFLLLCLLGIISLTTNAENKHYEDLYRIAYTYEELTPKLLEPYSKYPVVNGVYYFDEKDAKAQLIVTKDYKILRTTIPKQSDLYGYQYVQMRACGFTCSTLFPQLQVIQERKNDKGKRVDYSYAPGTDKHSFLKIEVITKKDRDYVIVLEKIVYKKRHSFKQKVTKPFRCSF